MPYHNERYYRGNTFPSSFHRYEALSSNHRAHEDDRNSIRLRRLQLVACVALAFAVMTAGISLVSLITTLRNGGKGHSSSQQFRPNDVTGSPLSKLAEEPIDMETRTASTPSVRSYYQEPMQEVQEEHVQEEQPLQQPLACSAEENEMVMYQLPEAGCRNSGYLCSISFETACPLQSWLEDYYNLENDDADDMFVGISVGCNKAFNAIDNLRMASGNPKFDKADWHMAIYGKQEPSFDENSRPKNGACSQEDAPPFPLTEDRNQRAAEMHCIEPILPAADSVQKAAETLGWDRPGDGGLAQTMVVSAVAIGNQDGEIHFPTKEIYPGDETMGMTACMPDPNQSDEANRARMEDLKCQSVPAYTLNTYADRHPNLHNRIHMLNIDTEGHDFDVLLGGREVLTRVEYLEFERHFKGPWNGQSLHQAVEMLNEMNFTCYFAGRGNLWRISGDGCFMEYFDVPCWSNIACANRRLAPTLASVMERTYQTTLGLGKDFTPANMIQKGPKTPFSS